MGQKVNPLGFRLGISKDHNSFWYAKPNSYSSFVKQDFFIRNFIKEKMAGSFFSNIVIKRKLNDVNILVYSSKNGSFFKENSVKKLIDELSIELLHKFNSRLISLNVFEVDNLDSSASFVAESIRQQLEKRVPFKRVVKNAISKVQESGSNVKGVKVQISGRLNGAEIARTEWVREGQVPLHTLRANIDYSISRARLFLLKINLYSRSKF